MAIFLDDFSYAVDTELVGQTASGKTWIDALHSSDSPIVVEGYEGSICSTTSGFTAATVELVDKGVVTLDGIKFEHIHQTVGFYFRCDDESSGGFIVYVESDGSMSLNSDNFDTEPEIASDTFTSAVTNSFASVYKLRIILDDTSCQATLYQDGEIESSISGTIGAGAGVFGGIFLNPAAGGTNVTIDKLTVGVCGDFSFSDPDPFTLTYGTVGLDFAPLLSILFLYSLPDGNDKTRITTAVSYYNDHPTETLGIDEGGGVYSLTYLLTDDPDFYYSVVFRLRVTEDIIYLEICQDNGFDGPVVFVSSIYSYTESDNVYSLTEINNAGTEITSCDFTAADDTTLNDVDLTNGFEWINSSDYDGNGPGFIGTTSAIIKSNKAGITDGNNGWGNLVNLGVPDYDISIDYFGGTSDGRLDFFFRMPNTAIRGSGLYAYANYQQSSDKLQLWLSYIGADSYYPIWSNNASAFDLPMGINGVKIRAKCVGSTVQLSIESNDELFETVTYDYSSGLTGTYFAFSLNGNGARADNFQVDGVNTDVYNNFPSSLIISNLPEPEDKEDIQDLIDTAIAGFIDNLDDSVHYICDIPENQIIVYGSSGSGPDQVQVYFDMRFPELRVDYNYDTYHIPLEYRFDEESSFLTTNSINYNEEKTKRITSNFLINYTGEPDEGSGETFDDTGSGGVVCSGTAVVGVVGDTTGLKYCAITVDHTQVLENGTYAVLVNGSRLPSELFSDALEDFGDVIFCSSLDFDGDRLPCEIVSVDNDEETAEIWVPVALSSTIDTTFYVVWGTGNESQPNADATFGSQSVWDSSYSLVYHFADANDSTSNQNNGTASNLTDNAGTLGSAKSFNGSSSVINIPDDASYKTSDLTVYGYVKPASSGNAWQKVLSLDYYANGGWSYPYTAYELTYNPASSGKVGGNVSVGGVASGQNSFRTSSNYSVGDWEFVAMNYSTSTGYNQVFLDADYDSRGEYYSGTSGIQYGSSQNLTIGQDSPYYSSPGEAFAGLIDEVRIKNVCDSYERIATEQNNFTSSDFISVGEVQEGESGESFNETATGGVVCSGSHSATSSLANKSTGGLVCSGSSNDSLMQTDLVGSGGIRAGGQSENQIITTATGGGRISGFSAINGTTNETTIGGITVSGHSVSISAIPGSGGITLSGGCALTQKFNLNASGTLLGGGNSVLSLNLSNSGDGGVVLAAAARRIRVVVPAGTVSADIENHILAITLPPEFVASRVRDEAGTEYKPIQRDHVIMIQVPLKALEDNLFEVYE